MRSGNNAAASALWNLRAFGDKNISHDLAGENRAFRCSHTASTRPRRNRRRACGRHGSATAGIFRKRADPAVPTCSVRQRDGWIGQIGIGQLAVNIVRLLQHVAGRSQHRFGLHAQRVWRGAQDILQEEILMRRKFPVLARGMRRTRASPIDRISGDSQAVVFADHGHQRAGLLLALLVGRIAQILVGLEAGIGEQPPGIPVRSRNRAQRVPHGCRTGTQCAPVILQLLDLAFDPRIFVHPGFRRLVQIGKVPHCYSRWCCRGRSIAGMRIRNCLRCGQKKCTENQPRARRKCHHIASHSRNLRRRRPVPEAASGAIRQQT